MNQRAIEEMKNTARAAQKLGVSVVNGFTGSSVWHLIYDFPPTPKAMYDAGFKLLAERWNPILDVFQECGVKFALEVHPTEIAFDIYTAERALQALGNREEFGFNFDPSHLIWPGYATGQFGKNHLGDKDEFLATNHGFDEFFGNPYHLNMVLASRPSTSSTRLRAVKSSV